MEDLRPLIEHLTERLGRAVHFTEEGLRCLSMHHWPGNVRELLNVLEQLRWIADDVVDVADLPPSIISAAAPASGGRSRSIADELFDALTGGQLTFWGDVYRRFIDRDMTRDDLRSLVRSGLEHADGNYRRMLSLFRIPPGDYKRLLNFLQAHDCALDFRTFRPTRISASGGSEL
jgi:DNA-binding NtrC family response regulator